MFGCGWKSSSLLFPVGGCVTRNLVSKPFKMVIQQEQEGTPLNLNKNRGYSYELVEAGSSSGSSDDKYDSPEEKRARKMLVYAIPAIGFIVVAVALVIVFALPSFTPENNNTTQNILKATFEEGTSAEGNKYVDLKSTKGRLRGYFRNSRQGREFLAFYKVPYAQPPLETLRFLDPQPVESWEGLRDVKEVAPQCIQKGKYSEIIEAVGEEDCLYMNIYTPSVEKEEVYPTLVYIHGGAYTDGNGSRYGAEYFLDEDVVLITFQFRLGTLSFLNSEDGVFPGNLGFKDQVMVLRWVKDNVASYGGDPNRVTIFGNSGGGASASFLMVSPLSSGLFHRAISQSGTAFCNMGEIPLVNPVLTVQEVGKELNCSTDTTTQLLECLRTKTAAELAVVRTPNSVFGLSIDSNSSNPFMPDSPRNLHKNKKAHQVPYIVGINSAELVGAALGILYDNELVANLNENWSEYAPELLTLGDMSKEEIDSIKTFYFGNEPIGNETIANLTNLRSDTEFNYCSYLAATIHGESSDTFLYYLSKPAPKSYAKKAIESFNVSSYGFVSHADEVQFLFPYSGYPEILYEDPNHYHFSEYFVRLWAQFATNGHPSGMDGLEWRKSTSREDTFWLELNDNPGETHLLDERMRFWDQFSASQLNFE
ncbi:unnamed protein product [Orchesella dallaii]|uniref:Carboxylesterase type B domain-containing protein n=1 Tax=Orchesella dallaii TaxID=48710 RepID=A0ABP1QAK5_9HEXA